MSAEYKEFSYEKLKKSGIQKIYEPDRPESAVIQAVIKARREAGLTQKELSCRTGITQSDISKLERGNSNPSVRTLMRIASGLGMDLKIEFHPKEDADIETQSLIS